MQVILDSSFARPGSAPIWGVKKVEFRDWTRLLPAIFQLLLHYAIALEVLISLITILITCLHAGCVSRVNLKQGLASRRSLRGLIADDDDS